MLQSGELLPFLKIRLGLQSTNTLAYFDPLSVMTRKDFIKLTKGVIIINLFPPSCIRQLDQTKKANRGTNTLAYLS